MAPQAAAEADTGVGSVTSGTALPDVRQSRPLRLLWLIDSLTMGGAETLTATFARGIDSAQVQLHVCSLRSIGGNPIEKELHQAGIPCTDLGAKNLRDVRAFRRLLHLIRRERIDLVHAHLTYASIWGAVASRITGNPCVATLHVPPSAGRPWSRERIREWLMCRLLTRWSARVLAVSAAQRSAYIDAGRLAPERLAVVHNGIVVEDFTETDAPARESLRQEFGFPAAAKVVITVSVLRDRRKGIQFLLASAPPLIEAIPDIRFLFVGDGPLKAQLQAQAEEHGLGEHVRWAGFRRDIPRLLAGSDLFVLPSLEDSLPTAIMEAMAAGLPVVSTSAGGIPEIIDCPRTGRVVEPADPEALGSAIADLLSAPAALHAAGKAAQERARQRFSTGAWVARLGAVYDEALNGKPGSVLAGDG